MVMNQGLEDTVTEVYSVDSQYSQGGGVVVQVTGTQSNKVRAAVGLGFGEGWDGCIDVVAGLLASNSTRCWGSRGGVGWV